MIIGIVGSRGFNDYELMCDVLKMFKITKIISGGAKGADSLAKKYAKEHNIPIIEYLPDWNKYGKSAGYIRNQDIVSNSEVIIAFWDMKSKGTKHSIDIATKMYKPLRVINYITKKYKDINFN